MRSITTAILICITFATYSQSLKEHNSFGANPGNLRMYSYIPESVDTIKNIPLVVVLHGCTQNAETIAKQSGWNQLANRYHFAVLYPEQKFINNTSYCFNWFNDSDRTGEEGEIESIHQMISTLNNTYSIDSSRVFIHGLSAGAAISVAYMANYPEEINAGAIFAGGAYYDDITPFKSMSVMRNPPIKTAEELANIITSIHDSLTNYPKLIIGHGDNDLVVNYQNSIELRKQWCAIHEISSDSVIVQDVFADNKNISREAYMKNEEETIIFYTFKNGSHTLPVDPGIESAQGGKTGIFAKDIDFFSTYYVAQDFGLIN